MKQPSQHLRGLLREVGGISASGLSTGSGTESGIIAPQRKGVGSLPLCHLPPVRAALLSPEDSPGNCCGAWAGVRSASRLCWDLSACQQTCPLQQWGLAVNAGEAARACRSPGLRLHPHPTGVLWQRGQRSGECGRTRAQAVRLFLV